MKAEDYTSQEGRVVRNYISVGDLESNFTDIVDTWSRSYKDALQVVGQD